MAEVPVQYDDVDREGVLNWDKWAWGLSLPFRFDQTLPLLRLEQFADLPVELLVRLCFQGLLTDADDTIYSHEGDVLADGVLDKFIELHAAGIKTGILSNRAATDRYAPLTDLDSVVVTNVSPKPNPETFLRSAALLELDPKRCVMVGDSFLTDGGSVRVGMPFIHVRPIGNGKHFGHNLVRGFADLVSRIHHPFRSDQVGA